MKAAKNQISLDLHWLLPDLAFEINQKRVYLAAPFGNITFQTRDGEGKNYYAPNIFKAGRSVTHTDIERPLLGWCSPTYGVKHPALSILYTLKKQLPVTLITDIIFNIID